MKYAHLLTRVASDIWAIDRAKGEAIIRFLAFAASGGVYTEQERAEKIGNSQSRKISESSGSLAIIPIHGVMAQRVGMLEQSSGGTSSDQIRQAINAAVADDSIKAILLHVDSPGGSVYGIPELASAIRAARDVKPVIAQIDSVGASAAYWVGSQATEINITPGGEVGSIGIVCMHQDLSKALDVEGIKNTIISAGVHKADGNPFEPLTDEHRQHMQERVDSLYQEFVATVASGRGVTTKAVESSYGQGRTLSAKDSLAVGMVDRIATFDETLARYASQGNQQQRQNYSRRAQLAAAKVRL